MPDAVRTAWMQLAGTYSSDSELISRCWQELEKKYTSQRRHYHNLQHIAALLRWCETFAHELQDAAVVAFAVFYHDVIYNVLRKDNEPRSAAVAVKRLQALGVPPEKAAQVKLFIEATQTHTIVSAVTHTTDLQWFLDFDMSILAADWPVYEAYTHQVRREYRIYPDKLYYPGRRQFLQHCLQAEHIFQTQYFKEQCEAKARENLAKELASIGS